MTPLIRDAIFATVATWQRLALIGLIAGLGVAWYLGQFTALFFLTDEMAVGRYTANLLIGWSLVLGALGILLFGLLADRFGRKPIVLAGCLIVALATVPMLHLLARHANPALSQARATVKVVLLADPNDCSATTNVGPVISSCDLAKAALAHTSVRYSMRHAAPGTLASIAIGDRWIPAVGLGGAGPTRNPLIASFKLSVGTALMTVGYPAAANPSVVKMTYPTDILRPQPGMVVAILGLLGLAAAMVLSPLAA